jgi:hypothetical protein
MTNRHNEFIEMADRLGLVPHGDRDFSHFVGGIRTRVQLLGDGTVRVTRASVYDDEYSEIATFRWNRIDAVEAYIRTLI